MSGSKTSRLLHNGEHINDPSLVIEPAGVHSSKNSDPTNRVNKNKYFFHKRYQIIIDWNSYKANEFVSLLCYILDFLPIKQP